MYYSNSQFVPWASYQTRKIAGMPGTFCPPPPSKEAASCRHATCHGACWDRVPAVAGIAHAQPKMLRMWQESHFVAEHWWNMPFKGTLHCDSMADGVVAGLLLLWQHTTALWRHPVWIHIVTSHNPWMSYEYSLPKLNRPRATHKHNPCTF